MPSNDNGRIDGETIPDSPDAHGRAALLLVESLIHALCEASVLSAGQAVEVVERATSVQFDIATAADGHAEPMWRSHALLLAIQASLSTDANGASPPHLTT